MFPLTPPEDLIKSLREQYYERTRQYPNPSDIESFLIELIAYDRTSLEGTANYYHRQNFLRYANGEGLDLLGEWLGVIRIPAQKARAEIEVTIETPHPQFILSNLQIATQTGLIFIQTESINVPENQEIATIICECKESGAIGNGFLPGEIFKLVQPMPYIKSAQNITTSSGGSEIEND